MTETVCLRIVYAEYLQTTLLYEKCTHSKSEIKVIEVVGKSVMTH